MDAALVEVPSLQVPVAVEDGTAGVATAAGAPLLLAVDAAGDVPPAAYQSLTPPCPLQAPLLDAALVEVPSLQVPVTAAAGLGATLAVLDAAPSVVFLLLLAEVPISELLDVEAVAGAAASDVLLLLVLVLVLAVEMPFSEVTAGAAVLASAAAPYHFLTPSWPLHAPLLEAAEV